MPAYNVAPYIAESIESVLAQTYGDFELVIVDDGSTDETAEIARRYAERDPRIVIVPQENRGLAAARNSALRRSHGKLIALLDSDDLWTARFLEKQIAVLQARPDIDIVTGNAWTLGSHEDGLPARPWPDPRPEPNIDTLITDELSVFIMSVFTRRVYDTIGGFDELLRTNEDYDFWFRAAMAGFRFGRNDEPLGYYRRRDDSLSASAVRMLRGALRVNYKHRPALLTNARILRLLDGRIQEFEAQLISAEARDALVRRDFPSTARHLSMLRERKGGATIRMARVLSHWMPSLLWRAYQLRRRRHTAAQSSVGS